MPPACDAYAPTLELTRIAIALWCSLSSSEAVVASVAGRAAPRAITRLRRDRVRRWLRSSPIASPRGLLACGLLRGMAGLALLAARDPAAVALLLALLILCTALLSLADDGGDGADKIAIVACVAGLLIAAGRMLDDAWLCLAGVAWGAGQLTIAYAASGAAKLDRAFWRDGSAIAAAMTSYRSGHAWAAVFVARRSRAAALSWGVMLLETLFPLAMLAPPAVCFGVLSLFVVFHFATALIMGLNTYPWAFIATYPCALMANQIIARALGLAD